MNIQIKELKNSINSEFFERTLIDIACIKSGILKKNFVNNKKMFFDFKEFQKGIPLSIPFIPELLSSNDLFEINKEDYSRIIFGNNSQNYVGTKLCYFTNFFVKKIKVKPHYKKIIKKYIDEILDTKIKISELKDKYCHLGAFQTRNIPHQGHEKIIEMMLNHCDAVVINPIVGPKKPGDVNSEKLKYIYENLLKPKFKKRIFFIPIRANMFYAGPREAIQHCQIREWLGFTHFSVGRDHAGSDNFYDPKAATKTTLTNNSYFNIKILNHDGAYFCKKCKKVLLKGTCSHEGNFLEEISGSEFRSHLKKNKIYKFASKEIAYWAAKNYNSLF